MPEKYKPINAFSISVNLYKYYLFNILLKHSSWTMYWNKVGTTENSSYSKYLPTRTHVRIKPVAVSRKWVLNWWPIFRPNLSNRCSRFKIVICCLKEKNSFHLFLIKSLKYWQKKKRAKSALMFSHALWKRE